MLTHSRSAAAGFSMIEVLVTLLIVTFGLLGLAGLQVKLQTSEMESYQRAQALVLLNDMSERIAANGANASSYASATALGTGTTSVDCTTLAAGSVARDQCEWNNELLGSAETTSAGKTGAMIGARGCITQVQAANPAAGVCLPGIYQVAVAWQGLVRTAQPAIACGQGQYGTDDGYRRVVSRIVTIGLPGCN